jgi:hypothetical protein
MRAQTPGRAKEAIAVYAVRMEARKASISL